MITLLGPTLRSKLLSVRMAELGQTPMMPRTRTELLLCPMALPSRVPVVPAMLPLCMFLRAVAGLPPKVLLVAEDMVVGTVGDVGVVLIVALALRWAGAELPPTGLSTPFRSMYRAGD